MSGSRRLSFSEKGVETRAMSAPAQIVGTDETAGALDDVGGERHRLAGLRVDRNTGEDADRGDLARLRVAHLVDELCHLLAHLEQRRTHRDGIAGEQLALVR